MVALSYDKAREANALYRTVTDKTRLRMFVAVTMDLGLDRSMLRIYGTRRIRKKRVKAALRSAALQSLVELLHEGAPCKPG